MIITCWLNEQYQSDIQSEVDESHLIVTTVKCLLLDMTKRQKMGKEMIIAMLSNHITLTNISLSNEEWVYHLETHIVLWAIDIFFCMSRRLDNLMSKNPLVPLSNNEINIHD